MKTWIAGAALLASAATVSLPASASAEGVFATGEDWTDSSREVKVAYIYGIANLMSAEYAIQTRSGGPLPDSRSAIPRLYRGTASTSIDQVIAAVDGWYAANPDELGQDVLSVIWLTLVER